MATLALSKAIVGSSISFSFILFGNAITQSFMTIPALLVDFPADSSPDYSARAQLLGRQWPHCWNVGNVFFRPISTLGFIGYVYTAYEAYNDPTTKSDWRFFALASLMNLIGIVHSAVNMQPLNDKIVGLDAGVRGKKVIAASAEAMMRKWAKWNLVRVVCPLVAGTASFSQII
ncbi:hypothetical protein B0J14DRAFT_550242 [Halenospora varia]|nr:hypothetical protein B0J14DRAFT_550242 [Halenospora varia]